MSKKRKILLLCILLCIPIPCAGEEGVVSSYRAVLYSYTRYRVLKEDGIYYTTDEFSIFPFNFCRNLPGRAHFYSCVPLWYDNGDGPSVVEEGKSPFVEATAWK